MKEVTVLIPCIINQYFPKTGHNLVRILESLGVQVHILEKQGCCGYPFLQNGDKGAAKEIAQKFLFDYQTGKRDHKTLLCSSRCEKTVMNSYPEIFNNSISHNLCQKVLTSVSSMWNYVAERGIKVKSPENAGLIVDCLCDFSTLDSITGFRDSNSKWKTLNNGYSCCGGGEGLPKTNPIKSEKMMIDIFEFASANQLNKLYFTNELCLLHAQQIAIKYQTDIQLFHLLDLIHDQYVGTATTV